MKRGADQAGKREWKLTRELRSGTSRIHPRRPSWMDALAVQSKGRMAIFAMARAKPSFKKQENLQKNLISFGFRNFRFDERTRDGCHSCEQGEARERSIVPAVARSRLLRRFQRTERSSVLTHEEANGLSR
jgi:hypothetical protein